MPPDAADSCFVPSGKLKPLPVVVIRTLPVTSRAVPDVTAAVLMPTLLVVTVIAPSVDALPTIVILEAVTAPVTVKPPVTVAPVEVNATAPIVEALPTMVMLEAVTAPVTVRLPVTVAPVLVKATAPTVEALPTIVILDAVILVVTVRAFTPVTLLESSIITPEFCKSEPVDPLYLGTALSVAPPPGPDMLPVPGSPLSPVNAISTSKESPLVNGAAELAPRFVTVNF